MSVNVQGGALEFDAVIRNTEFKRQIDLMEQRLRGLTVTANQQSDAMEGYAKKAALAVGSYLSFAAGSDFVQQVINVRGEFQKLEVAFSTMLKSKEKADQLMSEAVRLAAITPFTLQDVGDGAKQLLAYGFAQDKVIGTLQMLGDVAAGVGAPLNDIVYLYGTLQTQGRAYTKDIMQFTGRGIPIIEELAKQFGVSKNEVQALVEAGKVGFPEVERAFQNLTGSGGLFFNLMEKQSKTLTGQISNLEDAWSRMLNDIGKQNEGLLASTIDLAIDVVNNYEAIIDIIKVLAVAYGTYRAALIVTTVAQQAHNIVQYESALAGRQLTVVQALQSFSVKSLQMAWRALNATMLANPFTAIATVLAAVTTALILFTKESQKAKTAQDLLNKAQSENTGNIETQRATISTYVAMLQSQTASENERLIAYNKLKEIAPDIVKGLTLQQAATADLTSRTNEYIASLRQQLRLQQLQSAYAEALKQKEQADQQALELKKKGRDKDKVSLADRAKAFMNIAGGDVSSIGAGLYGAANYASTEYQQALAFQKAADRTLTEIENQIKSSAGASTKTLLENDMKRLQAEQRLYTEGVKKGVKSDIEAYTQKQAKIDELRKQIDAMNKAETAPKKTVRNEAFLKAEIQRLTDLRAPFAVASKEYKFYTKEIEKIQNELNPKKATATENKSLKEQQSILQDIADMRREATQSSMTKEKSEIDQVNESYEKLFQKIKQHNEETKVAKYRISQDAINGLRDAQSAQIAAIERRQNEARLQKEAEARAKAYESELGRLGKLYQDYENAKKEIGVQKAKEMYGQQIGDNESYLQFLQDEFSKYLDDSSKEGQLKAQSLAEAITNAYNTQAQDDFTKRKEEFLRLFEITADFSQKRAQLDLQYEKDVQTARKEFVGAELEERLRKLRALYEQETIILEQEAIKQSDIYKNLGRDLLLFSKDELTKRIKDLRKILKDGFITDRDGRKVDLTPQMRNDLKQAIGQAQQLRDSTGEVFGVSVDSLDRFVGYADLARNSFQTLAQQVAPLNQGLADTLATMSDIAGAASGLATAGIGIASGDPTKIVGGVMQLIGSVVNIFTRSKESIKKAQADIQAFQDKVQQGEEEINRVFRERERSQQRLNKLRMQGLKDELDVLLKQKNLLQTEYEKVFSQLQKESFVSGMTTQRSGGFLGIGRVTRAVEVFSSLQGKTFEDLEKLYTQNQLTGRAKELFETLQKIKKEGEDINDLIRRNEEEAKQIFTGTTTDSIVDSIVNGFKEGKRSAADFADSFQELMQGAILNALKYQALEKPLKEFYDQFAKLSQSGNTLTEAEITQLRNQYNDIINNASQQFENLQKVAGVGFGSGAGGGSSLAGAIKGMTEQQADLLAGQFGGLRITALEQLQLSRQALDRLTEIVNNTSYIPMMYQLHRQWDLTGLKLK